MVILLVTGSKAAESLRGSRPQLHRRLDRPLVLGGVHDHRLAWRLAPQVAAELADDALPVEMDVLADQGDPLAVGAARADAIAIADALAHQRDLPWGAETARVGQWLHGFAPVRCGHSQPFRCNDAPNKWGLDPALSH